MECKIFSILISYTIFKSKSIKILRLSTRKKTKILIKHLNTRVTNDLC